ncbi:hypothetical protein JCM5353_007237 [Sporobolomyces roseus]
MALQHGHADHSGSGKTIHVSSREQAKHLVDKYDTFLFDCDGVIWTGPAGDTLTPNILETLSYLRSLGKHVAFITNNATSSRQTYHDKFQGFGIETSIEEIFTCGSATADYLRDEVFPRREREGKKKGIYLIGQKAMEEEFQEAGLNWKGGTLMTDLLRVYRTQKMDVLLAPQDFSSIHPDPEIGVVVYAFQMRINYKQLAKAYNYLSSNPWCELILTNDDQNFLLPSGGYVPGEGAIASVLFGALPKGTKPLIVGKPHQPLLDIVHTALRFDLRKTLFVGDRLATDILFAKRGQIDSLLVFTGIQRKEDVLGLEQSERPEWMAENVGVLLQAKEVEGEGKEELRN